MSFYRGKFCGVNEIGESEEALEVVGEEIFDAESREVAQRRYPYRETCRESLLNEENGIIDDKYSDVGVEVEEEAVANMLRSPQSPQHSSSVNDMDAANKTLETPVRTEDGNLDKSLPALSAVSYGAAVGTGSSASSASGSNGVAMGSEQEAAISPRRNNGLCLQGQSEVSLGLSRVNVASPVVDDVRSGSSLLLPGDGITGSQVPSAGAAGKILVNASEASSGSVKRRMEPSQERAQKQLAPVRYSFWDRFTEEMALGNVFDDRHWINPDLELHENTAGQKRQQQQARNVPMDQLVQLIGFIEQYDLDSQHKLTNLQLMAKKQVVDLYPTRLKWLYKYILSRDSGDPKAKLVAAIKKLSACSILEVVLVLGGPSLFPGKEKWNRRTVHILMNDGIVFKNRNSMSEGATNVAWMLPMVTAETPRRQLGAGYLACEVALYDVLLGRVVELEKLSYVYLMSYANSYCKRFAARLQMPTDVPKVLVTYTINERKAKMFTGSMHPGAGKLVNALKPDNLKLFANDFLLSNLEKIEEALLTEDQDNIMQRMSCATAVELIGRVALHAAYCPFSTIQEVAKEFDLSVKQMKQLTTQLQFAWAEDYERESVARIIVATMLCAFIGYDNNVAKLQKDVACVSMPDNKPLLLPMEEALAVMTRVKWLLSKENPKCIKMFSRPEYIEERKNMLAEATRGGCKLADIISVYFVDVFAEQLCDGVALPWLAPSYSRVKAAYKNGTNFIKKISADRPFDGFKPPESFVDADGKEILAASWIHPFDKDGGNPGLEPTMMYVAPGMYDVGNQSVKSEVDINSSIVAGDILNVAYFVPPVVLPCLNPDSVHSLGERRMMQAVRNLRVANNMWGKLPFDSDVRGTWFTPLPRETHPYDDSQIYTADMTVPYLFANEPPRTAPLLGVEAVKLKILADLFKENKVLSGEWAGHASAVDVESYRRSFEDRQRKSAAAEAAAKAREESNRGGKRKY